MIASWAADPLGDGAIAAVEAIERAVTVELIATFEPQLVYCARTDATDRLVSDESYRQFDYLPVKFNDRVVGLLPLYKFRTAPIGSPGLTVEDAMCALDQSILITAGASVLRYIEEAKASPCRLVVRDTQIAGIVTISDLSKLAVRPALFVLVTHLELLMANVIRRHFQGRPEEEWLVKLGERRARVDQEWKRLKAGQLELDRITATQFSHKWQILVESGLFQSQMEHEFEAIVKLRNGLAHASGYASTKESAEQTIETVRLAKKWIAACESILGKQNET